MDFLAAEIARKRKEIATTKASTDSPNKKYIRQKDVAAERDKRYLEGQARLTAEREAKAAAKLEETRAREAARLAREERLRREKEVKLPEPEAKKEVGDDKVQERLRELEEPRVAFGETVEERRRRLEDVEMRVAVEKKRAARMAARAEEAPELERLENLTPDAEELRVKLGDVKGNPNRLYDQLYQYFKVICQEWTKSMDERDEEVKESPEGREALRIHLQCLEDFRPLFRALKRKVPPRKTRFHGGKPLIVEFGSRCLSAVRRDNVLRPTTRIPQSCRCILPVIHWQRGVAYRGRCRRYPRTVLGRQDSVCVACV